MNCEIDGEKKKVSYPTTYSYLFTVAKKDINDAVRGILHEKTSKFSNKKAHIKVFDNKLTQLFRALRGLL